MLLLGPNGRITTRNGRLFVDTAGTDCCCLGGAMCCGRVLPEIMYCTFYEVSVEDPLTHEFSHCCANGVTILLRRCQGNTEGTLPSRWRSDAAGEVFCGERLWWFEMSCALPSSAFSGVIGKIAVANLIDPLDCGFGGAGSFDCMPPGSAGADRFPFPVAPGGVSSCDPFVADFVNSGGGGSTPWAVSDQCCDDTTTVGWSRVVVTEFPP